MTLALPISSTYDPAMTLTELPTMAGPGYVAEVCWVEATEHAPGGFFMSYYEPGSNSPAFSLEPEQCPNMHALMKETWGTIDWPEVTRDTMRRLITSQGKRDAQVTALISQLVA